MANLKKLLFCLGILLEKRRSKRSEEYGVDLCHYIEFFTKNGQKPFPFFYKIRRSQDDFLRRWYRERDKEAGGGVWIESGYSFVLLKVNHPNNFFLRKEIGIASITFDIGDGDHEILINQIQGLAGSQEYLKPIKWERMLVRIVIDWARKHGFRVVKIREASQNKYYKTGGEKKEELEKQEEWNKRFIIRYNVTAKRLGFRLDPKKGVHVLELAQERTN